MEGCLRNFLIKFRIEKTFQESDDVFTFTLYLFSY